MTPLRNQLARLHLVWVWFLLCVAIVLVSEVAGAGMLDGGLGSTLFGVLFLIGAPLLIVGRIVTAATAWAPQWLQVIVLVVVVVGCTAVADRLLTSWLRDD